MPGKRGIEVLPGWTVMIPWEQFERLRVDGRVRRVGEGAQKRDIMVNTEDPVATLYAYADEEHKDWKLWKVVLGTAEGNLTYELEAPDLVIPDKGGWKAVQFIPGVTA